MVNNIDNQVIPFGVNPNDSLKKGVNGVTKYLLIKLV